MIGQVNLQKKLNSYDYSTLPQSIMIEGGRGCGKHLLLNELCIRLGVESENITKNLDYEYLSQLFSRVNPIIYVVDGSDIQAKEQNALLKFLEEPPEIAKVIILCENRNNLLSTIQNRCILFSFEPYTKDDLKNFTDNENLLQYVSTPGQVLELTNYDFKSILDLCNLIIDKIGVASIANILSLADKFDADGGFDSTIFFSIFQKILKDKLIEKKRDDVYDNQRFLNAYTLTARLRYNLKLPSANKKKLIEHYLLELKRFLRSDEN